MGVLGWVRNRRNGRPRPGDGPPAPLALEPPAPSGWGRTLSSLAIPDFRMLVSGLILSMAGMQIGIVARSWLAYDISGSGLTLGLVAIANGLPWLLMSLVAGVAADRFDKRKVLIFTQAGLGTLALVNAVLVHAGIVQVWHLVALSLLQGAIFALDVPTRLAYIPQLVGREQLSNAIAVHAAAMNVNRVLGPVIAGVLIVWNPAIAFYAVAALYGGAALALLRLPRGRAAAGVRKGTLAEIVLGCRYIWGERALRILLAMAFIPVLLGMPFQQLLPVFQAAVFHVGPDSLGLMYTAVGIGSLAGSLGTARFADHRRRGLLQMVGGVGFGVTLLLFALSTRYEVALALLVVVGLASQAYMTINSVLIMLHTDKQFYGRVMSVYMMTWSLMPIATLPLGALVDIVGAPATVAGAGALLAALMALVAALYPSQGTSKTKQG